MEGKLTWQEMIAIEPRLADLFRDAKAVRDPGGKPFCANHFWYRQGGLKDRLCLLVGWEAEKPELQTSQPYDIAYRKCYDVLPDCRHERGACW
jgi:hypothetical protein